MFGRFRQRSYELEHLDKGDYTPEEYEGCLVELRRVNRWLGDARALRRSVLPDIERDGCGEFSLLDVGAGSGELLREVRAGRAAREAGAAGRAGAERARGAKRFSKSRASSLRSSRCAATRCACLSPTARSTT